MGLHKRGGWITLRCVAPESDRTAEEPNGRDQIAHTSADRDQRAEARDERADAYDDASDARDMRAEVRDERAEAREASGDTSGARADRAEASRDRRGGASDRTHSASDRHAASNDRGFSAEDRVAASIDALTGAYRREAGLVLLDHSVTRSKRTDQPFTLAFADLDGLKGVNDSQGHPAGDELLRATAHTIRAHLRSYDAIIRFGGDEFLCGLLDLTMAAAAERFAHVNADLAATQHTSLSVGLAQLEGDETLEALILRADQALYRKRQHPRSAEN